MKINEILEYAETEMRYAGWSHFDIENCGRNECYLAVCRAIEEINTENKKDST